MPDTAPKIEANTIHVDEVVDRAMRGRVRIPKFQRGLKWEARHVRELFDSLYRGYPIGTLLMWKRGAPAEEVQFGPISLAVHATDEAWWVVDGQQRLTSLVAVLKHPGSAAPGDPFAVYFDLEQDDEQSRFFQPTRLRPATPLCVPLSRILDAATFQEWLFELVQETGRRDLIATASELATRIRNYRVPVYVVETDDADTARDIFLRTNLAGRRMDAHEVFAALAPTSTAPTHHPEDLARRLTITFGPVDPNVIVKAALALDGDDVTSAPHAALPSPQSGSYAEWMTRTEVALHRALTFLVDCGVPHLRLLPARLTPVVALARFFDRHQSPSDRSLRLLRRWLWRGFFADALASDAKTLRRAAVAVGDDESESVQRLLAQVPRNEIVQWPATFDARHGAARLAVLVMSHAHPWALTEPPDLPLFTPTISASEPTPGDVFAWLQEHESACFTRFPGAPNRVEARFLTPAARERELKEALVAWARDDLAHPGLASHLITPAAAAALLDGDMNSFLSERRACLSEFASKLHAAFSEYDHSDRPALARAG